MTLLKRVGGGAIALCLALVGLVMVAPLASAHANSIAGAAHCETDGTYTVDWTITNNFSASERVEKISNSGGTVAGLPLSLAKQNDVGHVASSGVPGSATSAALTVKGTWSDHVIRTVTGTVTLSGTCGDDDSVEKITICHATPADTAANGWVRLTVSANAITPRGHSEHAADIIPSFSYRKNGAALSYPGKNWDVKGKKVYDNNCTLPEPPKPPCVTAITDHAVSAQYVAGNPFRAYVAYTGGQLCKDVTRTVSLNSYATDGPTWGTSGTQVFVDHASITLSQGNTSGYLQVKAPSCYYQTDLYFGSTLFDGTHGDLPHYPGSVTPQPLIAARNGGHACPPPVVKPTGTFSVTCSAQGATVTVGTLSPGNQSHVVWTLKVNGDSVLVSSGQVVQVPAKAHLALSYRIGSAEPVTKQEQDAPAACPPTPTPTPTATTPTPTPTATTPTPTPTPTATTPTPTPTATTPTPTPTATTPTPTPTTSTPTTSTPTTSTTPTTSGTPSATDTPTDETSVLPTKIGKTPTTPTTPDTPSGSVLPHTGGSALAATTVIGVGLLLGGLLLTLWGRKRKEVIARRH